MNTTTIGLDIAKAVFQVHGIDARGQTTLRKRLRRAQRYSASRIPGFPEYNDDLAAPVRVRDPGLHSLKTDFLVDPLRSEPRFQAVMRELKFP